MNSAFLLPFIGPLPAYLPFWAKSCEINAHRFHWYVYSDQIADKATINAAVTLIPYRMDEMVADFKRYLSIIITDAVPRMICNYRLLFYFLRNGKEPLDRYDFIGYTDMDMIYGDLSRFMPPGMGRYAMISADPGHPCGPFTLMRRDRVETLESHDGVRQAMNLKRYRAFDESREFLEILSGGESFWCQPDGLQPALTRGFNPHKIFSVWDQGRVTIYDNRGHKQEGGFHHFSRYKDRPRFRISADPARTPCWATYKSGIIPVTGAATVWRILFSMMV